MPAAYFSGVPPSQRLNHMHTIRFECLRCAHACQIHASAKSSASETPPNTSKPPASVPSHGTAHAACAKRGAGHSVELGTTVASLVSTSMSTCRVDRTSSSMRRVVCTLRQRLHLADSIDGQTSQYMTALSRNAGDASTIGSPCVRSALLEVRRRGALTTAAATRRIKAGALIQRV